MKQAFITGASSDIGLRLCRTYLENGFGVVAHYNRGRKEFQDLLGTSNDIQGLRIDFSQPDETERQIDANRVLLAKSDVLVNLAGMYEATPFGEIRADQLMRALATNVLPAILLTQAVAPGMVQRGFGRIVNIGSIGVKFGGGSNSYGYALSKHALELIPASHRAWAASNVLINTLRVGVTDTRFHALDAAKSMEARVAMIPARRMAAPQEIADTIYWFGSNRNSYVTGQVVAVAGGE